MILTDRIPANKEAFMLKVAAIAAELGINPNWLMAVMYKESSLNPAAVNSYTGATGLIQFMPATAAALGTSTAALKQMSNIDQLDYVKAYLKPHARRIKTFVDCYLAVFFPAAMSMPADTVLQTSKLSPKIIADQNPAMDANNDDTITIQEVENWLFKNFTQNEINELKKKA